MSQYAVKIHEPANSASAEEADHGLQEYHRQCGVAKVAGLEARVMAAQAAVPVSQVRTADSQPRALYIGMWQVTQGSMPHGSPIGGYLNLSAGAQPRSSPLFGLPTALRFSAVQYSASYSSGSADSVATHCSRLLEAVQCMGVVGASVVQLTTQDGMHVGNLPVSRTTTGVCDSALQGLLRTAGS